MTSIAFLQPGDVLSAPKAMGLVQHLGVVVGPNQVLQNTPERGEHIATVEEFARQRPVRVLRTAANPVVVQARTQKALQQPRGYDLILNNCEHTVTKVLNGKPESQQVVWGIGLVALAMFAWSTR
jgi:hypothetical protein